MSLLLYGFGIGLVHGLWAVSFSMIYRSVRVFHVLHAAAFTAAAYTCWRLTGVTGSLTAGVLAGVAVAIAVGIGSEILFYRPLTRWKVRHALLFVVSLGAYILIENVIQLLWRADTRTIDLPAWFSGRQQFAGAVFSNLEIAEAMVSLALWLVTLAFLRFSMLGKAIRAISVAPEMAELAGIRVSRIRLIVFAYGSLLIGIAGILFLAKSGIEPTSGLPIWIVAVVASLISRSHPFWSYVTGFGIGLCEAIVLIWLPATWQPAIPVVILLAYLSGVAVHRSAVGAIARNRARRALGHA